MYKGISNSNNNDTNKNINNNIIAKLHFSLPAYFRPQKEAKRFCKQSDDFQFNKQKHNGIMSEGDRSFATGDGHSVWEDLQAATSFLSINFVSRVFPQNKSPNYKIYFGVVNKRNFNNKSFKSTCKGIATKPNHISANLFLITSDSCSSNSRSCLCTMGSVISTAFFPIPVTLTAQWHSLAHRHTGTVSPIGKTTNLALDAAGSVITTVTLMTES
ncbi:uncharacterized protein LOC115936734 [Leptonychotes weddellii]|uniref:Uncharacterized protein LOC115936734 n=1 Tax=Leptonychotes weddellii TaxID=9713 RepID=A0A7F8PWF5_LEPWE|nr:uncharacterized protein LOC115936734 [Leptonychotes weddellii]